MPKKWKVIFITIGRKWFIILIVIIIIVAIYNPIAAIWMSGITLTLFLLSFIPELFFKNKLHKFLKKYYKIEDELIARKFNKPLKKIREALFELSQNQEKKGWLITFLSKQYVFYHQKTIHKFIEFYNKGFNEKEILDSLKDYKLEQRAEIKVIKETLIKLDRLSEREISVKEHKEKQRFL
ncbi:MAG: hypothetical protein KAW51_01375 [Candidatus Lokiarchaeota archaeon]|nr:hypothetical protein [Candidatus Lokiarchaeota archaeon]